MLDAKKRESGLQEQLAKIVAGKTVADFLDVPRPQSDPRDADRPDIRRHHDVRRQHRPPRPQRRQAAANYVAELAWAHDDAVGDGTSSVVVFAVEVLPVAETRISPGVHQTVVVARFLSALQGAALDMVLTKDVDVLSVVGTSIRTTFTWARSSVL